MFSAAGGTSAPLSGRSVGSSGQDFWQKNKMKLRGQMHEILQRQPTQGSTSVYCLFKEPGSGLGPEGVGRFRAVNKELILGTSQASGEKRERKHLLPLD